MMMMMMMMMMIFFLISLSEHMFVGTDQNCFIESVLMSMHVYFRREMKLIIILRLCVSKSK